MVHFNKAASALTLLISGLTTLSSSYSLAVQNNEQPIRPNTVVFKLASDLSPSELKSLNALLNSQSLVSQRTLEGSQITIATFEHKGREQAIANIIKRSGLVEFAEPDYAIAPSLQPNDPSFSNQWHHRNINSEQAWDISTGSNTVLVGVCDTGFDVNHPDLADNMRTDLAFNAQDGSSYIFDANGHGTGTAGTLGAVGNNSIGVAGVNWNVDIIPVRIAISDDNSSAYISTMAACIEYAADNGARVVNLSYGGIQYATIDSAAQYLRARGGLLFMSAGNSGQEFPEYPDYSSFIGVGATDQNDNRASFSSYGNYVDLTAPGVSIRTTYPNNSYINYSGTSFSSPVTAGVAALMVAANPSITPDEIEAGLFSTAVDIGAVGDDNIFGHGLVNAAAAVNYAINLGNYATPAAQISVSSTSLPFGSAFSFSGVNSSDTDGSIVSYRWNLGDGTSSEQLDVMHTYDTAGSYQVSLTVTDNDGLTDTATQVVQVTNSLPDAVIDEMETDYALGDSILFNSSGSSDSDGTIVAYEWSFGDGFTSQEQSASHSYDQSGSYTVILTVTDNAGGMNSNSIIINVADPFTLSAPTGLTANVDGLDVALSWEENNDNETAYVIERGQKQRGKVRFEEIATVNANITSFVDTVGSTGNYDYRVSAINSVNRATSESIRVTVDSLSEPGPTPGDMPVPTNLQADLNGDSVSLSWSDNTSDELGFYIERGIKAKGGFQFIRIGAVGAGMTSFTDDISSLGRGSYGYRVQAYKDVEQSGFSNIVEIRKK